MKFVLQEVRYLQADEKMRNALNIDFYDAVLLLNALNDEWRIDIPEEDYGKITILVFLTNYLEEDLNSVKSHLFSICDILYV